MSSRPTARTCVGVSGVGCRGLKSGGWGAQSGLRGADLGRTFSMRIFGVDPLVPTMTFRRASAVSTATWVVESCRRLSFISRLLTCRVARHRAAAQRVARRLAHTHVISTADSTFQSIWCLPNLHRPASLNPQFDRREVTWRELSPTWRGGSDQCVRGVGEIGVQVRRFHHLDFDIAAPAFACGHHRNLPRARKEQLEILMTFA